MASFFFRCVGGRTRASQSELTERARYSEIYPHNKVSPFLWLLSYVLDKNKASVVGVSLTRSLCDEVRLCMRFVE